MKVELGQVQKMLEWLKTKLYIDSLAQNARTRTVKRGQVYRCNFGCGVGSEMQKERPAVVIQNDVGNVRSGNTIVIPITHDTSVLPCVANITPLVDKFGNIILDGQANASNLMCVSKARLGDLIGTLSKSDMKMIDEAIAKALDLMSYYADMTQKLSDKLSYIERLKEERNQAQDVLEELRELLELTKEDDLVESVTNLKFTLDNKAKSQ